MHELLYFGAGPTVAELISTIDGALAYFVPLIADAIAASGAVSIGSIADIILTTIAGVSLGPISLTAIGALASVIVGY
jgi:uncharacterized Rossmann fold enzyme